MLVDWFSNAYGASGEQAAITVKRVIRGLLGRAKRTLLEDESDFGPSSMESYTLNRLFVSLTEKEGCGHAYTWGAMQAARLACELGIEHVSMIEFGVAGGNSLLALERVAEKLESHFAVGIDVYGFDSGAGLPKPVDARDMPNLWGEGAFAMEVERLESRLTRARLILGLVGETVPAFVASGPAPVAFVAFDLDLYSSTTQALELFSRDVGLLLPRVHCYFDDILGYTFGDHLGERLAIADFNDAYRDRKISPIYGLQYYMPQRMARDLRVCAGLAKYYLLHVFDHPLYGAYDGLIAKDHRSLMLPPDA